MKSRKGRRKSFERKEKTKAETGGRKRRRFGRNFLGKEGKDERRRLRRTSLRKLSFIGVVQVFGIRG